ncbi:class V aminotransferase [Clostridium botulinum]|uniref:Class V aminotransferase n=1 Tax=Clostridium botulinum TaxID=1491 RepID=A0A9Q1ZAV5_CLOBO|nr:alanine--glyoxylate aminotransferase family protein [Clostridium botulinum]KEI05901.1 class V aminotransferase [Clostridium botulinum C/D str. Sp77]KOA78656.1 class V aminotransferase [Clostridium botulinum]KOA81090.1 class V aminotransferase [Clostridium botulinum]KOA82671.1 class V aminotransferase [Clostridium botulinum]KOA86895.1 class V aminotransferase [Clostridium botulinum]
MINKLLMTPGPTNVPDRVLRKMGEEILHHRTKEFGALFGEMSERLKYIFQTKNSVLTFPASGTGGLEAAIINMFSKGDKILAVSCGVFGDRFITIAKIFGIEVDIIKVPLGTGVKLEEIKNKLTDEHKGLIVTHNETSTAVTNNIEKIGQFMKGKKQLFIVDGVSSVGGIEVKMDQWNIDVLITASQKALMSPPGLFFAGVSDKAWEANKNSDIPKFYLDFKRAKEFLEKPTPQNPYTPAVSLITATNEALKMMEEEGLYNIFKRHNKLANKFRDEVEKMGLSIYTDKDYLSNTVTAIKFDKDNIALKIKEKLEKEYNIIIAGGQGDLKGKIIRFGHMGCINQEMIYKSLDALKKCL